MEIKNMTQGLTADEIYNMTKGSEVRKMQDAKGEVLKVEKFVLYTDVDMEGNIRDVLAIETDKGVQYATSSKTFIRNFFDILSIFDTTGEVYGMAFSVGSAISKSGREFLTCDRAYSV